MKVFSGLNLQVSSDGFLLPYSLLVWHLSLSELHAHAVTEVLPEASCYMRQDLSEIDSGYCEEDERESEHDEAGRNSIVEYGHVQGL